MKRLIVITLLLTGLNSAAFSQAADEKAVASGVTALHKAMIEADKIGLENLIANELSYGHSNGKVDSKATFIESVVTGINDYVTIDITNQTITIVGNIAMVRHTFNAEIVTNNTSSLAKLGILLIWIKQQNGWRLLGRQAFKL